MAVEDKWLLAGSPRWHEHTSLVVVFRLVLETQEQKPQSYVGRKSLIAQFKDNWKIEAEAQVPIGKERRLPPPA